MNIPLYHRIVATAAICLATTTGLNRCIGMPNNGGESVARLYIEDISTSEDLYEDGSFKSTSSGVYLKENFLPPCH